MMCIANWQPVNQFDKCKQSFMGKCFQLLFVLVLSGSAPGAAAESLGYTFVSADYYKFSSKIDGISEVPEGSGMSYAFSIAVRPYIAVTGAYTTGSGHVNTLEASIDTDIESTSMGVLIHLPINETADFILATGFINGGAEVKKMVLYLPPLMKMAA